MTVLVRPGLPADADAAGEVFLACWQHSYVDLLVPEVRAFYDRTAAVALWRRILITAPDGVLVAEVDPGGVRGLTRFGADPDDPLRGHIFSLYVHPDAQRLGLGRALLDAAGERLAAVGFAAATLWVFAGNASARAFYAAQGWTVDGATRVEPEYGEPEVRLIRAV